MRLHLRQLATRRIVNEWDQQNEWATDGSGQDEFAPSLTGGVYEPTLEDVLDNVQTLGKRMLGPILIAWGAIAAVHLILSMIQAVAHIVLGPASLALMFVSIPVWLLIGLVLGALRFSLYRPMRDVLTGGAAVYPDLGSLKDPILGNFVNVMLVTLLYSLAVGVGALLCGIPGLIALVVFSMAPYYAANGTPPVDAMRDSFEAAKRYPILFVVAIAATVFILGLANGVVSVLLAIIGGALGEYGVLAANFMQWMSLVVLGAVALVIMGATFATIDLAESGERVVH